MGSDDWSGFNIWILQAVKNFVSFGTFINPLLCRLAHQYFILYHLIQYMEQFQLLFYDFWTKILTQNLWATDHQKDFEVVCMQ